MAEIDCELVALLRDAKANVEKGWCKKTFEDKQGNVCALGALGYRHDTGGVHYPDPVRRKAGNKLAKLVGVNYFGDIAGWNDNPNRTYQQVKDVFDRALLEAINGE